MFVCESTHAINCLYDVCVWDWCFHVEWFHLWGKEDEVFAVYIQWLMLCVLSWGSQGVLKGADINTMKVNQNVFQFNPF